MTEAPLRAVLVNCSLKRDPSESHTMRLMRRVAGVLEGEGVDVDVIHALDHRIAFGMVKDGSDDGPDDWPALQERIVAADICIIGTPIWLGVKSSVATLVIERMYAYSGDTNDKGQFIYYGKAGGCVVTGNEDGVKACSADLLYSLQHIGYVVPPQADCGWIGEVGPGPSYGDVVDGEPAGYNREFTNKNATIMARNLVHTARLLRSAGGFPVGGNTGDTWQEGVSADKVPVDPIG